MDFTIIRKGFNMWLWILLVGIAMFWIGFLTCAFFVGVGRQNLEADLMERDYEIRMLKDELKREV